MQYLDGQWYMQGVPRNHPDRIKDLGELITCVERIGFLPLFGNEIDGFSVEDRVCPSDWWTQDPETDPWEWRCAAARSGRVAYGKFFGKKAGFISLAWLPYFVNVRRDGYDFDSRYEEGLARHREYLIMQLFRSHRELASYEIRQMAGFGKGGEKNFSGILTDLQMQMYLTICDMRRRKTRKGIEYGMPSAVFAVPETLYDPSLVTAAYAEDPAVSWQRIARQMQTLYPEADERQIRRLCGSAGFVSPADKRNCI